MKDQAEGLSQIAEAAIEAAKSSCPTDLRVAWFGIEGTWKGTRFDRTIRDYLIIQCNVPVSDIRSRKRGEVADAGAQEDAARVIEDISDHFNWRPGVARAIFYLGDEALEGGGDRTDQEDIEAANLAIQKAKKAGVTVHTYFGTSKSKYREGIEKEYARVASETGGEAFTDKDSLSGFTAVLEKVICGSRPQEPSTPEAESSPQFVLRSGTVYVQDCVSAQLSNLYTLDLSTAKATFIRAIATEITDIAFVGAELYGLDHKDGSQTMQLIKIDPATGESTVIGDIGFFVVGLAYNRDRQTLYASAAKQLIAIDIKTGAGTPVVTVANQDYNCGEVAFDRNGKAYITLIGYDERKLLATCDLDTGSVTTIGDTGFPGLGSMEFYGNVLYGVTGKFFGLGSDGQLIQIDTTTGAGTLLATTNPIGRWAGISVYKAAGLVP